MYSEMDLWRLSLVLIGIFQSTQGATLRCYNGALDDFEEVSLYNPEKLLNSTCINLAFPTLFYTFGYRGKVDGLATRTIISAYMGTKKRNVILLDWQEEASGESPLPIPIPLPVGYALSAVPRGLKIGTDFGNALVHLARAGMNMTQMHLMGHSLGAHVMANAGRRTRELGLVVARITGLDPARALFEGAFAYSGLDRTCARFVDIVHTDPGGYGISKPRGTVDFWPNYAGDGGTQPGCPTGDFEMFSSDDLCSHDRSWRYVGEAIGSPTAFPASYAEDYDSWVANGGRSSQTIYLGDLANTRAQGDFFLVTAPTATYGLKEQGLVPDDNQTRRRRSSTWTRILKYLR